MQRSLVCDVKVASNMGSMERKTEFSDNLITMCLEKQMEISCKHHLNTFFIIAFTWSSFDFFFAS